jgi:hypothetical protein
MYLRMMMSHCSTQVELQKQADAMPVILEFDDKFSFHLNEHSEALMLSVVDAYDCSSRLRVVK